MPLSLTDLNAAFKGTFLKAADVANPTVFTIKDTSLEPIGEKQDMKPVIEFTSGDKLVLNKTNRSAVTIATGTEDPAGWNGKHITLVAKKVEFKGEYVDAVRVDPNSTAQPATDSEPF